MKVLSMWWPAAVVGVVAAGFAARWLISAVWVAFIADRWNEFDSDEEP